MASAIQLPFVRESLDLALLSREIGVAKGNARERERERAWFEEEEKRRCSFCEGRERRNPNVLK